MKRALPPLMAVVDADVARRAGWAMADLADAYLSGGATLLQIRAKNASSGWMLETAFAIVSAAHAANAIVIVNDRADIAAMSLADGVHVGQDDLPVTLVRRVIGDQALVGLSTHTTEQLDSAFQQPVSYAAIGPVFGTGTKATGYDSLGLDPVRSASNRARQRGVPLVAIGGITLDTAPDVLRAGASAVAVISDLVSTGEPAARVRAYLERLRL